MNGLAAKFPDIVKVLLIVGIAYTLVTTLWHFLSGPEQSVAQQPVVGANSAQATGPAVTIQSIINANIFGDVSAAPAVAVVEASNEPAKETRLPLTLLGVFQAEHAEESAAIVAQKGKAGLRYGVGQTMPGNAELVEVYADHIILRRAGVRETLRFPKSDSMISESNDGSGQGSAQASVASRPIARNSRSAPTRAVGNARITPPIRTPRNAGSQPTTVREAVEQYRDQLDADPEGTLNSIGVTPVSAGDAQGYQLGALANSPQLQNTGLLAGDVLLSVNGEAVGNIQSDRLRMTQVLAEGSARLEIMRGTRRFFVTAALP